MDSFTLYVLKKIQCGNVVVELPQTPEDGPQKHESYAWTADKLDTVDACVRLVMAMVSWVEGRDGGGEWHACWTKTWGLVACREMPEQHPGAR